MREAALMPLLKSKHTQMQRQIPKLKRNNRNRWVSHLQHHHLILRNHRTIIPTLVVVPAMGRVRVKIQPLSYRLYVQTAPVLVPLHLLWQQRPTAKANKQQWQHRQQLHHYPQHRRQICLQLHYHYVHLVFRPVCRRVLPIRRIVHRVSCQCVIRKLYVPMTKDASEKWNEWNYD